MTANAIPTLATGNVFTQAGWASLTQLNTAVGLYGAGSSYIGANATGSPGWLIRTGTSVIGLSAGLGFVAFSVAFPSGLLMVLVCDGDSGGSATPCGVNASGTTLAGFQIFASGVSGSYRVNWLAIGF